MTSINRKSGQAGWGFWLQWLIVMAIFLWLSYTGIDLVERPIVARLLSDPWVGEAFMVLGLVCLGTAGGLAQWLLLRPRLKMARQWGLAMALTYMVGASLAELASFSGIALVPSFALSFLLLGPICGILQWLSLRTQVQKAGWWVLAQSVSWLVLFLVSSVIAYGASATIGGSVDDYLPVSYGVGGAVLGAITGAVLVWLLNKEVVDAR